MSLAVSSNVMKTPGSPNWSIPLARNSTANSVLPLPVVPPTNVDRPAGSPPSATWSKPLIPVRSRSIGPTSVIQVSGRHAVGPAGTGRQAESASSAPVIGQVADHPPLRRRREPQDGRRGQDALFLSEARLLGSIGHLQLVSARQERLAEHAQVRLGRQGPLGLAGDIQPESESGHVEAQRPAPAAQQPPRCRAPARSLTSSTCLPRLPRPDRTYPRTGDY